MADDLFDYDDDPAARPPRDNLFIWTVFILLLIGLAFACWLGSFYVFGHPEEPRAYALLKKLKKIEAIKRFEEIGAPPGEFLSAQRMFERYSSMGTQALAKENAELLRNYVRNYKETKKLVAYLRGNFTIMAAGDLQTQDFFTPGGWALAVSNDFPQVLIEHLYPMDAKNLAMSRAVLDVGNPIKLEKTYDLGAVIHVERVPDGRLLLTVVPLLYGSYALSGGVGTFSTQPPLDLNVVAGLPVVRPVTIEKSVKAFADYQRSKPVAEPLAPGESAPLPKGPEIVRLDTVPEGVKVPETGALPAMPVATPVPLVAKGGPTPRQLPPNVTAMNRATPRPFTAATPLPHTATPITVAKLNTPLPVATPIAVATPLPRPAPGVELKPFVESKNQPGLPGERGNVWRTYKPGSAPTGRAIAPGDAGPLAERGNVGERTYLRGNFVVKASGDARAVLRPRLANGDSDNAVRVIVEYPNGSLPPAEGAAVDRDEQRPYEITEVRRGASGEVNIWVREIIQQ